MVGWLALAGVGNEVAGRLRVGVAQQAERLDDDGVQNCCCFRVS
jgi:hypothetical protein